jgi:hypothetical protein
LCEHNKKGDGLLPGAQLPVIEPQKPAPVNSRRPRPERQKDEAQPEG